MRVQGITSRGQDLIKHRRVSTSLPGSITSVGIIRHAPSAYQAPVPAQAGLDVPDLAGKRRQPNHPGRLRRSWQPAPSDEQRGRYLHHQFGNQ